MNIWWIRRDLRLNDNQALTAALKQGKGVIPVFILDQNLVRKSAEKRAAFLFSGLKVLDASLRRLGSRLIIRSGNPSEALIRLIQESAAQQVFAEEDISPNAIKRDAAAARLVDLQLVGGLGIHPVNAVRKPDGQPYTVFTPYSHAWKRLPFDNQALPAPEKMPEVPESLQSDILPDSPIPTGFPPGEDEALHRLEKFLDGPIHEYENGRNRPDIDGTSLLSPYLRFGMISARQAAVAAKKAASFTSDDQARASCEVWINELIWREFYQSILYHFPHVLDSAFRPSMQNIAWRNAPGELAAWESGHTGYPIVDAGMRQLASTGWMHNRARMISASFLVKHLLINWQEGESWFMKNLIDGDPAANNGGWQWTAGTGTDAAPYFRIFNPILQGKKFDPGGIFIRKWLPELESVPAKYIHCPWEMSTDQQREYKTIIGSDYPAPLVEHEYARRRALEMYSLSKSAAE